MDENNAITPAERGFSDSTRPPDENQLLTVAAPTPDVRARRWGCLVVSVVWALGALIVPFPIIFAGVVLGAEVLVPRGWDGNFAYYGSVAVGVLVGGCCLWRVSLPLDVRTILVVFYVLVMSVMLVSLL
jgi:hypothetical protein